jgi:hypothetical protein
MASTSTSGSLATARPNARSLRASAWRVEKAALLSQGGPSRCARSARGAGASRGRTGAVVVEAKIWTDDGRRRAAELMGLTREVRPAPRAARHPRAHLLYFLSRGAFSRLLARHGIRNRPRRRSKISLASRSRSARRGGVVAPATTTPSFPVTMFANIASCHRAIPDADALSNTRSHVLTRVSRLDRFVSRARRRKLPTANA